MRTDISVMTLQEREKKTERKTDKRQILKEQMVADYVLSLCMSRAKTKTEQRLSREYYPCVIVPGEEYFIQYPGKAKSNETQTNASSPRVSE